jgi:hypothetical protein
MRRDAPAAGRPFHFPGAWIVPFLGIGISLWILAQATRQELMVTGVVLVAASVVFVIQRSLKTRR